MNYFWVNIGETYQEVEDYSFLWAPLPYLDEDGKKQNNAGWSPLEKAEVGDIFFCKNGSTFEYVAIATKKVYESKRPAARTFDRWKQLGRRVDVQLIKLKKPIASDSISDVFYNEYYDKCKPKVINKDKNFCEIYSSLLPLEAGKYLLSILGNDAKELYSKRKYILENDIQKYVFPFEAHSWTILNENVMRKVVDTTLIKEKTTGIPLNIVSYLHPTPLSEGQKVQITLLVDGEPFNIPLERKRDGRYRLNLSILSRKLKLNKLLENEDLVWLERDLSNPNCFDVYISSKSKSNSITPKNKPKNTTAETKVNVRRGQDYFKALVSDVCNARCVVTGVKDQTPSILIGSHIKAWSKSSDEERMDGENGLLLAPHIDKLFDVYLISFSDNGEILVSNKLSPTVLDNWGVNLNKIYSLTPKQFEYMKVHRKLFEQKQS
ncbi:HNH endonuclease [Pseudoalteromonas sp. SG43-4]|uniref:HNH endonuclease n=1 Tax=Pseudoalteromonas sp. SG43-4 TaxID=2760969 RepID=UPI001604856C|nr:HNH endonuclease signature motif containing protein [Pseudoalteromonas sp. SG43-4]MBB1432062.1 HNH endonuclease [Pseudoalteromonas sp. SG43-4]